MDEIVFNREKQLGLITLNRVHALNALTLSMILALQEQLQRWQTDDTIHAVVIQAAPGKAFCAGGDVRWLHGVGRAEDPQQMEFFWNEYRLNYFIHSFSKPYIALMDGVTMGGGVGISLHGSHPVASERFVFAMPETSIGFFPDVGASYLLARCPGSFGVYLGLTGDRLNAEEACHLGLAKYCIPSDQFANVLNRLLDADLSKNAHVAVDACLQTFAAKYFAMSENHTQAINEAFAYDQVELIFKSLQESGNEWHHEILKNLQLKAPLSLKVTLEQMLRAKSKSMAECVITDYCLVQHFMREVDFYEGVRALLIDKDKSPHWQPSALGGVLQNRVEGYFNCIGTELILA